MTKRVCRNSSIHLGGYDISHWVSRWAVVAEVGEVMMAEIDIIVDNDSTPLKITQAKGVAMPGRRGMSGGYETNVVAIDAKILIGDTDISDHIAGWDRRTRVGKPDTVRLLVQADSDILTINGTHPWLEGVNA